MVQKGITGKELIERWDLFDDDIFRIVTQGLQPYDKFWKPMSPPGSGDLFYAMTQLKAERESIEQRYPKFQNINYEEWCKFYLNRQVDAKGKLEKIADEDDSDNEIRGRYETIIVQIERLEKKCSHFPKWFNYILPKKVEEIEAVKDTLLNAHYKIEDIFELDKEYVPNELKNEQIQSETQHQPRPEGDNQLTSKTIDDETFIRMIQVSYSSDTSIFVAPHDGKWEEFTHEDMGFKQHSKTWRLLINILQDKNHTYFVVSYDNRKNPDNVKEYNKSLKNFENCSKKFIVFLNKTYSVQIREDFNVFENMKGRERPGTYKPKFQVVDKPYVIHIAEISKLSKNEIIKNIKVLSEQLQQEKNTDKIETLLKKIGDYLEHARNMKYLSDQEINNFIILPDEFATNEDAMSYAVSIDNIKNR